MPITTRSILRWLRNCKNSGEAIHRIVCERGYSNGLGHFVQYYGGDTLDASLLLLPLVGFLPADDPRIGNTIAAIERNLMEGGLVRRGPAAAARPGRRRIRRLLMLASGLLQDAGPR